MRAQIGFHIEISSKIANIKKLKAVQLDNGIHIVNASTIGKIGMEKKNSMILVRNKKDEPSILPGIMRFSIMNYNFNNKDIERVVKIINVLGNDRLIREKVNIFTTRKSALNSIPELMPFVDALSSMDKTMPGFTESAWYYAPEVVWST